MVSLLILLIIAGFAAYQYLKGNFVHSFLTLIVIILSIVPAFAFFEYVSNFIIARDGRGGITKLVPFAQPLCFFIIFGLSFAILESALSALLKEKIDLDIIAERVGRVVCGALSGLLLSGIVLVILVMSPLPEKYPYERFLPTNPSIDNPKKTLFNADGFAIGWFNLFSKGSLSGKRSFSVLHPNFLDVTFLNRLGKSQKVSAVMPGSKPAIEVPKEKGVWLAPQGLTDNTGKVISQRSDSALTIVRVGLKNPIFQPNGIFTPLQLRLICKEKSQLKDIYNGSATVAYPIGYLKTSEQMESKSINSTIKIQAAGLGGLVKWVDFIYYVPTDTVPVLLAFKSNTVLELSSPVDIQEAPEFIPFEIPKPEPEPTEETGEQEESDEEEE
ncbi:MAG: hypothetical protein ACYSUK_02280 [Planctomycetota bacterium]|jgi:hypothetical protein